jgi:hypothetical protein
VTSCNSYWYCAHGIIRVKDPLDSSVHTLHSTTQQSTTQRAIAHHHLTLKASSSTLSPKGKERSILQILSASRTTLLARSIYLLALMQAYMEGAQLGTSLPSFVLPDSYAFSFPPPPLLQLPTLPKCLLQITFDQGETGNHGAMPASDQGGLYSHPALPFGFSGAGAGASGGKPTAGFMPSVEEVIEVNLPVLWPTWKLTVFFSCS